MQWWPVTAAQPVGDSALRCAHAIRKDAVRVGSECQALQPTKRGTARSGQQDGQQRNVQLTRACCQACWPDLGWSTVCHAAEIDVLRYNMLIQGDFNAGETQLRQSQSRPQPPRASNRPQRVPIVAKALPMILNMNMGAAAGLTRSRQQLLCLCEANTASIPTQVCGRLWYTSIGSLVQGYIATTTPVCTYSPARLATTPNPLLLLLLVRRVAGLLAA